MFCMKVSWGVNIFNFGLKLGSIVDDGVENIG